MDKDTAANSKFEGWAVVELFGHVKEAGYVTTEYFGASCFFRVTIPDLPEREFQLTYPQWGTVEVPTLGGQEIIEERRLPVGAIVKRMAVPGKSRLVGSAAIYSLNPCTEQEAMKVVQSLSSTEMLRLVAMPSTPPLLVEHAEAAVQALGSGEEEEEVL